MSDRDQTQYRDVPGWELSDSFWERIEPLLPKPKSRYRGRGKRRRHLGGRPPADPRGPMAGIL
jgi:transposase